MNDSFALFNPSELLLILKHLKLGRVHLKKNLSEEEFQELIDLVPINETAFSAPVKNTEFLMPLNTLLTGVLGAGLGLSSYLEISTNSLPLLFTILAIAIVVGITLGTINVRHVKNSIQEGYENRKIEELQKCIQEKIQTNRKKEIDEKMNELSKIVGSRLNLDSILNPKDERVCIPSLKKLVLSRDLSIPKPSWIRANLKSILISFVPTLIGGFGSLFYYLPNVPKIAKGLGQHQVFEFLTKPEAKFVQLVGRKCVGMLDDTVVVMVGG